MDGTDPQGEETPGRASWPANQFFSEVDISNCLSLLEVREMFIEYRLKVNGITLRLDAAGSQLGNAHLKFPSHLRTPGSLAQQNLDKYKALLAEHEARSPRSPRSPPGTPRSPGQTSTSPLKKKTSSRQLSPRPDAPSDSLGSKKGASEGSLYIPPQIRNNRVGREPTGLSRSTGVVRSKTDTSGQADKITLTRSPSRTGMGIYLRKATSELSLRDRMQEPTNSPANESDNWHLKRTPQLPRVPSPPIVSISPSPHGTVEHSSVGLGPLPTIITIEPALKQSPPNDHISNFHLNLDNLNMAGQQEPRRDCGDS